MEENQPKTGKVALKYGVILGIVGIVFSLMLYFQDLHYQIDIKRFLFMLIFSLIVIAIGAILGLREFKKLNSGFISFGQGLKIGVGMAVISGIIGIAFGIILSEIIDPEMNEKTATFMESWMSEMNAPEEQIQQETEKVRNPNYFRNIGTGLLFNIIFGFIGTLIPALVMKNKRPE